MEATRASKRLKTEDGWDIAAVLPDELTTDAVETVDATAIVLKEKRFITKVVKWLEVHSPFRPEDKFLKRVSSRGTQAVIIYETGPSSGRNAGIERRLADELALPDGACFKVSMVKVPKRAPATRKQFEESKAFWPVHFFEDKNLESLLAKERGDIWRGECRKRHVDLMERALELSRDSDAGGAAVAVEPSSGRVLASCARNPSHLLQHACMRLVDCVAHGQGGGAWPSCAVGAFDPPHGGYLLTGCDVYASHEPCVMCTMALVHSRIKRLFFCRPSPQRGACQSLLIMNNVAELNHSFEVFKIIPSE